jgi:type III secretion protein N (ATPase)
LFERAGAADGGSITAFYSVLVEDEDSDPIGEEVRSLLDGHIRLSRQLSEAGRYPPVDVRRSVSRLFRAIASPEQIAAADRLRALLAKHAEIELLLQVGEFKAGGDPLADAAVARMPDIEAFLRQDAGACAADEAVRLLLEAVG